MGKVIVDAEQIMNDARIHEQLGAERERRRIRRAQLGIVKSLAVMRLLPNADRDGLMLAIKMLDTTTRAPKTRRK